MKVYILPIISIVLFGTYSDAAKILAIFPVAARSHFGSFSPFLEELANRGHQVTVISAFPRKVPMNNYRDVALEDTLPARGSKEFNAFDMGKASFVVMMLSIFKMCYESCGKVLKQPNMQKFIHGTEEEFDLVFYQPFLSECTYGLVHKFNAPSIQLVPNSMLPWNSDPVGNPSTISYIPVLIADTETLHFEGRVFNFLRVQFLHLLHKFYLLPKMEALMREHFNDPTLPTVEEIRTNASFLFLHSHPVLNYPRPLTPNTIEVGGLHIKETHNLPQDLQIFLDDAPEGVIYFSLGSNVRSLDIPETKRNGLLKAFSKLKQKVLWKWEADTLPGQPKNVRLGKWLPQHDILAHPNVRLFITHGGLMSTQEATFFGMPLIAIPVMADQKFNALRAQKSGYAVIVDVHNITEESMDWALQEVLHEPRYRENAKRLSSIFRDAPQKPMERAVFWTEYAIRHKGAPHMRSAALKLNFFQYYLLDVIAVLSLAGLATLVLLVVLVRMVARCLCSKSSKNKAVSKTKKKN